MGLSFGFVLKTVLITQRCFSYRSAMLTQSQDLFCFSHCPANKWVRGAQEVGRGHSWDSWLQIIKGISHSIWCHAQQ